MRSSRPGSSSFHRLPDIAILVGIATLGIVVSIFMFRFVQTAEQHERQEHFILEVQSYQRLIEERIQGYQREIGALHRFFLGSEYVSATEFQEFVSPVLASHPGISAIAWLPAEALVDGPDNNAGYRFGPKSSFPPEGMDKTALESIVKKTGSRVALSLVDLQPLSDMDDMVLLQPVINGGRGQQGYLLLQFNPRALLGLYDRSGIHEGIRLEVYGLSGVGADSPLVLSERNGTDEAPVSRFNESWTITQSLPVADKEWRLVFRPLENHFSSQTSLSAWGVLALGIGMAMLAVLYIRSMQRRSALVNKLVARRTLELESTRNREQAVLQTMVDGVLTIDEYGLIQSLNPAVVGLFGYTEDELIGQNVSMLMPEPYRSAHDAYLQKYKHSGEAHIIGIGREVAGLRRNGEVFPLYLAVSELRVDGERFYTGIVRDITPIKQAEQGLLKAKAEAEAASEAKTEFLARMTHELRTPLNAILGFGQLMQMEEETLSDSQRECLAQQMQGGENLLHLIDEVLAIAQLEEGDLGFTFSTVPAGDALETAKLSLQGMAEAHQIEVGDIPECDACVRADRMRLQEAMAQLISNAIKFNKPGGHVGFGIQRLGDGRVQLAVTDTGIGIEEQDREKVFEPFIRVALNFENIDGGGVGLTMARKLVEAMGGEIGFESLYGEGSRFWVNLPEAACNEDGES